MCVLKDSTGKEVGRVAATASNASTYMETLTRHYGTLNVTYEQDADAAMISRMLSGPKF